MNEQSLRREVFEYIYKNKDSHPHHMEIVDVKNFEKYSDDNIMFWVKLVHFLEDLGLVRMIGDGSTIAEITTHGKMVYENKGLLNNVLPVFQPETEETQKLASFVEEYLKSDSKFSIPYDEYNKAYEKLFSKSIDYKISILSIVRCIEVLFQVLLQKDNGDLGKLRSEVIEKFSLHKVFGKAIDCAYSHKGDVISHVNQKPTKLNMRMLNLHLICVAR